jgi:hypothetical protein
MNIPLSKRFGNTIKYKEIYKNEPLTNWSVLGILNKLLFKLDISKIDPSKGVTKPITIDEKYELYNCYNTLSVYFPLYLLIGSLLILTECKGIWEIQNSSVLSSLPSSYSVLYFIFAAVVGIIILYKIKNMIGSGGQQYQDIWTDIKTNKFKSFYTVVMIVAIGVILLINFVLPSIISPIIESTDLTDTQKDWLTYGITGLVFVILAIVITTVFLNVYKSSFMKNGTLKRDAAYFSMVSYISMPLYIIISLLFVICAVTFVFSNIGQWAVNLILAMVFFGYFIVIYIWLYTIFISHDYNKLLLFTLVGLIFMFIITVYFLYRILNAMLEYCDEVSCSSTYTVSDILFTAVLPVVLFGFFLVLIGNYYWGKKEKFIYLIYFGLIAFSLINSNLVLSGSYAFLLLIVTIVKWKCVMGIFRTFFRMLGLTKK